MVFCCVLFFFLLFYHSIGAFPIFFYCCCYCFLYLFLLLFFFFNMDDLKHGLQRYATTSCWIEIKVQFCWTNLFFCGTVILNALDEAIALVIMIRIMNVFFWPLNCGNSNCILNGVCLNLPLTKCINKIKRQLKKPTKFCALTAMGRRWKYILYAFICCVFCLLLFLFLLRFLIYFCGCVASKQANVANTRLWF